MNTPKQPKPAKRWDGPNQKRPPQNGRVFGISNQQVAASYGFVVSYWWHVEEAMIWVLADLLSGDNTVFMSPDATVGQVFRSIVSNDARIKLMRSLLTTTPQNRNRSLEFDQIIDEFERLNRRRNGLVHGVWHTDPVTQLVTVAKSTPQGYPYEPDIIVNSADLLAILNEMRELVARIFRR